MKDLLKLIEFPGGKIDNVFVEGALAVCAVVAVASAAVIGIKVCTDEKAAHNVGRVVDKVKGDRKANT